MKIFHWLKFFPITLGLLATAHQACAADVGVSVTIGQPGFYGRIDIGDYPYPHPRVIYREPIIVHRHIEDHEPIYMRVPPGHAKRWSRYCSRYDACDRPVYFVEDRWYNDVYVPQYREHHGLEHEYREEHNRRDRGDRRGHHREQGRD